MKYLLDTDICIYTIKRKPPEVLQRFNTMLPSGIGVSAITVAELEYGAAKSQNPEGNRAALQQFLMLLEVVSFDTGATRAYGTLRSELEGKGCVIGSLDMLIAAQALSLDMTLVTNNTREYSRLSNLK